MLRITALILLLTTTPLAAQEPLRIAVAANFRATLEQINRQFEQQTGQRVQLSSASTGMLQTQILHGAPFQLFFAADDRAASLLLQNDIGVESFCYASGSLVLAGGTLQQLQDASVSLAIANPATAPYGRAAAEVLAREEFAAGSGRKLVRGNNVVQAYQFLRSGAVDMALVAAAMAPEDAVPIPTDWHQPLAQHALVIQRSPALDGYLNWFRSDTVRTLILDAGYQPCP